VACVCGSNRPVTYHRVTRAFEGEADNQVVICESCEGLISSTQTVREQQLAAGELRWQSFPRDVEEYDSWRHLIWSADALIDAGYQDAYSGQSAVEVMTDQDLAEVEAEA